MPLKNTPSDKYKVIVIWRHLRILSSQLLVFLYIEYEEWRINSLVLHLIVGHNTGTYELNDEGRQAKQTTRWFDVFKCLKSLQVLMFLQCHICSQIKDMTSFGRTDISSWPQVSGLQEVTSSKNVVCDILTPAHTYQFLQKRKKKERKKGAKSILKSKDQK